MRYDDLWPSCPVCDDVEVQLTFRWQGAHLYVTKNFEIYF